MLVSSDCCFSSYFYCTTTLLLFINSTIRTSSLLSDHFVAHEEIPQTLVFKVTSYILDVSDQTGFQLGSCCKPFVGNFNLTLHFLESYCRCTKCLSFFADLLLKAIRVFAEKGKKWSRQQGKKYNLQLLGGTGNRLSLSETEARKHDKLWPEFG